MSNLNNLLVSDCGEGNPCIRKTWTHAVIYAVLAIGVCLITAFYFEYLREQVSPRPIGTGVLSTIQTGNTELATYFGYGYYGMLVLCIVLPIIVIIVGSTIAKRIKSTSINVYENKVSGLAVGKDFSVAKLVYLWWGWNHAKLTNFDLAINQITSVDIESDFAIIINSHGVNYKCFVSNNAEIRDCINDKIRN